MPEQCPFDYAVVRVVPRVERGEFDVYRSSFVTKVEGYGEDGLLLWVATGAEPVKVRMRQ